MAVKWMIRRRHPATEFQARLCRRLCGFADADTGRVAVRLARDVLVVGASDRRMRDPASSGPLLRRLVQEWCSFAVVAQSASRSTVEPRR
jgi:hypothetical protein